MCIPAYFYISYLWQDNLERNTGLNDTLFNAKYMHSKDGFFRVIHFGHPFSSD